METIEGDYRPTPEHHAPHGTLFKCFIKEEYVQKGYDYRPSWVLVKKYEDMEHIEEIQQTILIGESSRDSYTANTKSIKITIPKLILQPQTGTLFQPIILYNNLVKESSNVQATLSNYEGKGFPVLRTATPFDGRIEFVVINLHNSVATDEDFTLNVMVF